MATLFALLHSCGRVIKMQKGLRSMRVCKSVCQGISIPLPWAICSQTDPIMFVLQDQIGCVPPSLSTHWCPFQPGPCTSQLPFQSLAQGRFLFSFIYLFWKANSAFSPWQPLWTDVSNYFEKRNPKDRRIIAYKCTNTCISEHVQGLNAANVHITSHLKPKGWDFRLNGYFSAASDSKGRFCDRIIWESCHEISLCLIGVWKWCTFLNFLFLTWKKHAHIIHHRASNLCVRMDASRQ